MNIKIIYPKISVITPVFNNAGDLSHCIESVAKQNYRALEHWIIDGGSTDGTIEIIEKAAATYDHVKWISEKDKGIYDAMNKGIERAQGEWIYFLGSDDRLIHENILSEVFEETDYSGTDILYGNILLKEDGVVLGEPMDINKMKWTCTHHQATFTRKSVFDRLGKYSLEYPICADWAYTIHCFRTEGIYLKYLEKVIAVYSMKGKSNTYYVRSPRYLDHNFNRDFFSLFPYFPWWERIVLRLDDHLPKYLNPKYYIRYIKKVFRKIFSFT